MSLPGCTHIWTDWWTQCHHNSQDRQWGHKNSTKSVYIMQQQKQIAQVLNHDLRYYKKNLVLLILCRCAQWLRLMTITLVNWCSVAKKWVVSLDEHSNNMPVKSRIKFMAVKTSGFFQLWSLTNIVLRSSATDHSPLSKCCHTYNLSLYIIVLLFRTDWVSQKRTFEKNWSSFTSWMSFQSPNQQCQNNDWN